MAATLIGQYFGRGLAAARPAAPSVDSAASAFYYATDTAHLYVWTGAAWATLL